MNIASVLKPFVFRIDPARYPSVAARYADDPGLFEELRAASDSPESISGSPGDLIHYARFFQEVKAQIGCAGRPPDDRTRRDLRKLLEDYGTLIQPAAIVGRFGCHFDGREIRIEGMETSFSSGSLSRFFTTPLKHREEEEYAACESERPDSPPPTECLLFAATIGPGIDQEVAALSKKGETYRALLLNGIGAGAADMVGVDLECWANHWAPVAFGRWRRFHIGYGDFKLEAQRLLFGLLDPERIGLVLNEACVMIPEKSVSGFMAVKRTVKRQ